MNKLRSGLILCGISAILIIYAVVKLGTSQFQYASVMMSLYSWHSDVLPPQAQNFSYMFWNFYSVFASIIGAVVLLAVGLVLVFWAGGQYLSPRQEFALGKST